MNLGVDPRHADQMVRGVSLPNGTGKSVRVAVFAREDKAEEAKEAGADLVGADDLAEKYRVEIDFDRCIATPDMMAVVGRLGKVLAKRADAKPKARHRNARRLDAAKAAKGGEIEFRVEKAGHCSCWCRQGEFFAGSTGGECAGLSWTLLLKPSRAVPRARMSNESYYQFDYMGPGVKLDVGSLGVKAAAIE